jgi:hypothetical protein
VSIEIVPIGKTVLPDDLVAPLGGDLCCGLVWFAPIMDVAKAAFGVAPLVAPCCGRHFRARNLGLIAFFSQEAWDAAPDDETPEAYYVGHAFALGGAA